MEGERVMQIKKLKIALVQMLVSPDKEKNLETACLKVSEAAQMGVEMVVLPEMFNCPYSNDFFRSFAEPKGGKTWQALSECASKNDVLLVAGSIPELDEERVFNTSFVFDPNGAQIARHRKVHLFDIDVVGGQRFFESVFEFIHFYPLFSSCGMIPRQGCLSAPPGIS